tara:strand:- start:80 stop:355 length:276 start_codon:yes stop_codon:yes gene_type:complete
MSTQLVLDETIRTIVREELKKSGLTNFNDEMDARADEKLEEFFGDYDLEEKFKKHCENWIKLHQPQSNNFITENEFCEMFDDRLLDVKLSR